LNSPHPPGEVDRRYLYHRSGEGARKELLQRRANPVAIESCDHFLARDHDRPLDQIRLFGHQSQRLLCAKSLAGEAHRFECRTPRIKKIARIATREQILQLGRAERRLRVVAFVEFRAEILTQETSCVAARGSSRFPDETNFPHATFLSSESRPSRFAFTRYSTGSRDPRRDRAAGPMTMPLRTNPRPGLARSVPLTRNSRCSTTRSWCSPARYFLAASESVR